MNYDFSPSDHCCRYPAYYIVVKPYSVGNINVLLLNISQNYDVILQYTMMKYNVFNILIFNLFGCGRKQFNFITND